MFGKMPCHKRHFAKKCESSSIFSLDSLILASAPKNVRRKKSALVKCAALVFDIPANDVKIIARWLKKSSTQELTAFHAAFLNTIWHNKKMTTTGAEESELSEGVSQLTGRVVSVASVSAQDREKHFLSAIIPKVCFSK